MRDDVVGFVWDEGNRAKCQKHGVSLREIEHVFHNEPVVLPSRTDSAETRFVAVGLNAVNRHVFIVFTLRENDEGESWLIRPISARYMHSKEVQAYERDQRS